MALTITASMINSNYLLQLNNKLKKPEVEKMNRERINSSMEKLKSLLGEEFLKQQPDSRQEKADILEMTVYFLRQQQSHKKSSCSTATDEDYSRCVQEAINFLCQRLLSHFLSLLWRRAEVSFLNSALQAARSAAKKRPQAAVASRDPGRAT